MQKNRLKEKLRNGQVVIGSFVNIPHPSIVELMALSGFDFFILDAEHTPVTPETAEGIYRAAELRGISSVTRIGENSQQVIQKFLEGGCQGVQIPLVNTREEAVNVVNSVKYPPIGRRGLAGSRSTDWGMFPGGLAEHVRFSNENTFIVVQVETREAVANFDEIVTVEHIDCIFFGPGDLSCNLGYPGQPGHPEVVSIIERLGTRVIEHGKVAGTIARNLEDYKRWTDLGFQYLCTSLSSLLRSGFNSYLKPLKEYRTTVRAGG